MKVIQKGHIYELENVDGSHPKQILGFIEKDRLTAKGPLETVQDGTTTEEVLAVLIDRVAYLDTKLPSKFNEATLASLEAASQSLQARTADRIARGVEGTHNA